MKASYGRTIKSGSLLKSTVFLCVQIQSILNFLEYVQGEQSTRQSTSGRFGIESVEGELSTQNSSDGLRLDSIMEDPADTTTSGTLTEDFTKNSNGTVLCKRLTKRKEFKTVTNKDGKKRFDAHWVHSIEFDECPPEQPDCCPFNGCCNHGKRAMNYFYFIGVVVTLTVVMIGVVIYKTWSIQKKARDAAMYFRARSLMLFERRRTKEHSEIMQDVINQYPRRSVQSTISKETSHHLSVLPCESLPTPCIDMIQANTPIQTTKPNSTVAQSPTPSVESQSHSKGSPSVTSQSGSAGTSTQAELKEVVLESFQEEETNSKCSHIRHKIK